MLDCLDRALAFFAQPARWCRIQRRGMSRKFGWDGSAERYLALYRKLKPCSLATDSMRFPCAEDAVNVLMPAAA
jgi:glycogen synthase